MRILISGASIAGPVLAYWLTRYGFDVTVVERAPTLRKTGGHAVDLFRPAMEISAKMGVLPRIEARATGTDRLTMYREGRPSAQSRSTSPRSTGCHLRPHVEIMRDDLSEIYYDAARDDVEYVFGDSITAIATDGDVTFEHSAPRTFDVIVGADGLHSNVRRLTFGDEAGLTRFLGGYLAVVSAPKALVDIRRDGRPRRCRPLRRDLYAQIIWTTRARCSCSAASTNSNYDHRDALRQKELLRDAFTGMHRPGGQLAGRIRAHAHLLLRLDHPTAHDTWSRAPGHARRRRRILPGPSGGWQHQPRRPRRLRAGRRARRGGRRPPARLRRLRTEDARAGASQPDFRARRRQRHHPRLTNRGVGVNPWSLS